MAQVTYSAGIDHVSGALAKPGKSGQHSCEKMLLATHRVAAAMIAARKEDLSKITDDQIAFAAQRNEPNGKKTMLAWYWKVCGDEYDESHG